MTCARCQQLEEEVAYLKSELGLQASMADYDRLHDAYGVTKSECRILMALYGAKGRPLSRVQLEDALQSEADNLRSNLISVFVSRLRKKLGHEAAAVVWGEGYRLTEYGRAQVARVLQPNKDIAA